MSKTTDYTGFSKTKSKQVTNESVLDNKNLDVTENKGLENSPIHKVMFGKVTTNSESKLNVRKQSTITSEIIHVLENGEDVEVVEDTSNEFYKIKFKKSTISTFLDVGYCLKEYVKIRE